MRIDSVRTPENTAGSQRRITGQRTDAGQKTTDGQRTDTGQKAANTQQTGTGQKAAGGQRTGTGQKASAQSMDIVSKNIRDKISEVQRQKQSLSSKQEMSEGERTKKKQELQQELNSLNTRLRQRQAEIRREQKKEERLEELSSSNAAMRKNQGEAKPAGKAAPDNASEKDRKNPTDAADMNPKGMEARLEDPGKADRGAENNGEETRKDSGIPQDKMQSIVAGDIFKEQTHRRETVIARVEGGIAILKGEIRQDEMRGEDADKKKAELKTQETKARNAAKGLPVVNLPANKADKPWRKVGQPKPGTTDNIKNGIVKQYPDGVVVIT